MLVQLLDQLIAVHAMDSTGLLDALAAGCGAAQTVHADLHEVGSGRLVHIQDIADDGIAGHLLCGLVFFLFEHIENIKHDVFPFCLGALTANPAVPL